MKSAQFKIYLIMAAVVVGATGTGSETLSLSGQANAAQKTQSRETIASRAAGQSRGATVFNVLLITVDTLRADHLACYGYKNIRTPTVDALAHDGILFERAIAQVPLTWPSHAAIMTGTYPFQNGIQDFTSRALPPDFHTIAEGLKRHGYATGAVVSTFVLDRSWGLARGFDYYDDAFAGTKFLQEDIGALERKGEQSVTHALNWLQTAWLKKSIRSPFFLWLHLYDPHSPYTPPEPYQSEYRDHLYDGEIAYDDHQLGRLIGWLKRHGIYDSCLIVFLSDHGESLGEHDEREHGFFVYNSTVRVPLIVKPPTGSRWQSGRVTTPVETIEVAPTIFQILHFTDEIQKQFQTKSAFDNTGAAGEGAYSETFYPFSYFGWSPLYSLQTNQYHYVEAPEPELYDLVADPYEKNNVVAQHDAIAAVLKDRLHQRLAHNPFTTTRVAATGISPDVAEKLRALGYVAYRSPVSAADLNKTLSDPKGRVWEFNGILHAGELLQSSNYEAGQSLLESIGKRDPDMYLVPFMLAEAALRRRDWTTAISQFQKCLELNPNFDQAMTGFAQALHGHEEPARARQWLDRAVKLNPQNYRAWYEIGKIDSSTDTRGAISAYRKAIAIQPNFPLARRDLGVIQLQQGKYPEAAEQLETAIGSGLRDAVLYNFLGIAYSRTNRLKKAVASYQRAVKSDPGLAQAHLNLAYAYQRLDKPAQAQAEYRTACQFEPKFCVYVPKTAP